MTVYRFQISLSDVDRAVYEDLDLYVPQHPSETDRFLIARVLAYCLSYEAGLTFSKGGISNVDEPLAARQEGERYLQWIEVGAPSAERLHKASKACPRVSWFTWEEPRRARQRLANARIHKADAIEVVRLPEDFLDPLAKGLSRNVVLVLTSNEGELYAEHQGTSHRTALLRTTLAAWLAETSL